MTSSRALVRLTGLVVVALLAGCATAAQDPTITARGKTCSYSGPEKLPAKGSITWDVEKTTPGMDYEFYIDVLEDGKTAADLDPIMGDQRPTLPDWLRPIKMSGLVVESTTQDYDLYLSAAYHGEPLHILCTSRDAVFAVVGPIEVGQ